MSDELDPRCFAVRRVNPFVGVLQILDAPFGRAISADGLHWDLGIRTERPRVLGGLERDADGRAFIRFGLWSAEGGHAIANSRKVLTRDSELRGKLDRLVAEIARCQPKLPFALTDSEELWLFDETGHTPLVLLATRRPEHAAEQPEPQAWRCSPVGEGTPAQRRFEESHQLEALIRRRAGFNVRRSWVARRRDGSGLRESDATCIEASEFPGVLVRRHWNDAQDVALVERYLAWSAPALLTLSTLEDDDREWLETQLHRQATAIEHHRHLYPKILSPRRVKAARVQSRFMLARGA